MPTAGSYRLHEYPPRYVVRLACDKCGRKGQYRRETLIARFGADFPCPSLLSAIPADCPRVIKGFAGDACGARFVDSPPWRS